MKLWKMAALGTLLAAGISSGVVMAQQSDYSGRGGYGYGHGMMRGAGGGAMFAQRLAALRQDLALSPQQESTWNAFSQKVLDLQEKQWNRRQEIFAKTDSNTLPERLDMQEEFMKLSQADRAEINKEMKAFYGTLSPEQKVVFDRSWQPGAMMGGGFQGRGPHGRGQGMGMGMGHGGGYCWQ